MNAVSEQKCVHDREPNYKTDMQYKFDNVMVICLNSLSYMIIYSSYMHTLTFFL